MTEQSSEVKIVATNRRALHDYFIMETYEAGIALKGTEVKSLRQGEANLRDSYGIIKDGEVWLLGLHISPFEKGNINNHDPKRIRKLLMHKREIRRLVGKIAQRKLSLIPLRVYFKKNMAKVELAVARGKKEYDKRVDIMKREAERELQRRYAQ